MGAGVAGHSFQRHAGFNQLGNGRVGIDHFVQLGADLHRFFQRHIQREGNGLGHLIHRRVAHAHRATHVAHHGFGLHGAEGDDLRHMIRGRTRGRINHFLTPFVAKRHVDIRQLTRAGFRNAEQQIYLNGYGMVIPAYRPRCCPGPLRRPGAHVPLRLAESMNPKR